MLGGSVDFLADQELRKQGLDPVENTEEYDAAWPTMVEKIQAQVANEHDEVRELGGLYVVGTERHESRRIDNQLRGRSGRQGDPGESRFYLSLQDELMRLFKSEWVDRVLTVMKVPDDVPIENKRVTGAIANAQGQVESQNFESRKNVLKYDDVMNRQREVIYAERREVLEGADLEAQIRTFLDDVVEGYVTGATSEFAEGWDLDALWVALKQLYPISLSHQQLEKEAGGRENMSREVLIEEIKKDAHAAYDRREAEVGEEIMRELERRVVLSVLDRKWREHLYEMDYLREGIYLRAYSQRDPLVEYQREGFDMFATMMEGIKEESVGFLFNLDVEVEAEEDDEDDELVDRPGDRPRGRHRADAPGDPARSSRSRGACRRGWPADQGEGPRPAQAAAAAARYSAPSEDGDAEVRAASASGEDDPFACVGRNALCPCGSGKKYKRCHGAPGGPTGLHGPRQLTGRHEPVVGGCRSGAVAAPARQRRPHVSSATPAAVHWSRPSRTLEAGGDGAEALAVADPDADLADVEGDEAGADAHDLRPDPPAGGGPGPAVARRRGPPAGRDG